MYIICKECPLWLTRTNLVIGRGNFPAKFLFIGEGPGEGEDSTGEAFVGPSGKLLDMMIHRAGMLAEDCYFTNTVLCRPCDAKTGDNRKPKKEETLSCRKNLYKIILTVKPQCIIFVGKVSETYNKWIMKGSPKIVYRSIIHPAHILRNGGVGSPFYFQDVNILEELNSF